MHGNVVVIIAIRCESSLDWYILGEVTFCCRYPMNVDSAFFQGYRFFRDLWEVKSHCGMMILWQEFIDREVYEEDLWKNAWVHCHGLLRWMDSAEQWTGCGGMSILLQWLATSVGWSGTSGEGGVVNRGWNTSDLTRTLLRTKKPKGHLKKKIGFFFYYFSN